MAMGLAAFSGVAATAVTGQGVTGQGVSSETADKTGAKPAAGAAIKKKSRRGTVNPLLSLVRDPSVTDMQYWRSKIENKSRQRTTLVDRLRSAKPDPLEPLLVDEEEPNDSRGSNDAADNAQPITKFGSAKKQRSRARILGNLAPSADPEIFDAKPEDNGSIQLATETGLTAESTRATSSVIGDGPHGSHGSGHGDFDFYAVRKAVAGQRLNIDIDTPEGDLDSVVVLWNAAGEEIAANDDSEDGRDSALSVDVPASGDYFVSVGGYPTYQSDPFSSGSGSGTDGEEGGLDPESGEGPYDIVLGLDSADIDYYAVELKAGDVLSASSTGAADKLSVLDPQQRLVMGSGQDFSGIYPMASPLAGGGNAVLDHVATESGTHYVAVQGSGTGGYDITLEVYRPGPEVNKATQTIFLDFNGQRVNTGIFGGNGVSQLSPLSAFTGRWGIPAAQQNALIDQIVATVTENLKKDFDGTGVKVKILNSRDDADPFGKPNVSRLIVGGTIAESGVDTIGIAQSIDPGNFETAETALILLDVVSSPAAQEPEASFNAYLKPASDRIKFVGTALGNIASHEAGHYLGNWHVDQFNTVLNLMDQGGNFPLLYGVGPDGIGGTADDPDIDFGEDTLNPNEGYSGLENTRTRTVWGLIK